MSFVFSAHKKLRTQRAPRERPRWRCSSENVRLRQQANGPRRLGGKKTKFFQKSLNSIFHVVQIARFEIENHFAQKRIEKHAFQVKLNEFPRRKRSNLKKKSN